MSKLFRPKTMRRMVVFLAMVAPAVYLFGVSFSALTGAHGEQVFAEPVYVEDYVEVNTVYDDGVYKMDNIGSLASLASVPGGNRLLDGVYFRDRLLTSYNYFNYNGRKYFAVYGDGFSYDLANFLPDGTDYIETNRPWVFTGKLSSIYDLFSLAGISFDLYRLTSVPSDVVPENNSAYTDFWYQDFLPKDNFLVQWGRNAISDNPYGFAPFGYFWRYLDTNVLHLSNDQAGLMAYGYMYYASHVLLFDVGFILVTFFLTFIQKVADKIGGDEHA